ncbi:PD-(D/E)XK nuclease family protein [Shewanella sp. 10N.286.52.B9]|uniref:PD-(D/E)XK nuclease family protein n=1 Tax=Shewanella sp. 10N.286.52.B9 TaxID=1880837 RepID=UPI000C82EB8D|nr:PD-(D/E)XK nuclease family protein [Shewanella sp. 10N.286.52.B9]PMG50704.1 hypothetical protein BCU91_17290 [Shewanella sp. 10N.286.52.B9]
MNNSLLVNVSKYASNDKTSPTENFITEAFAWLLRNDKDVREVLSELLKSKGTDKAVPFELLPDSGLFDTQVNFNGVYPDMLWNSLDKEWSVIFEHKVWSELHDNQLSNYRKYAKEQLGKEFILVLITAHVGQHRQNPDIAICWHEIATEIELLDSNNEKTKWIRSEFIQLIKSHGLVDVSPINPLSIAYYNESKKLDKQLFNISERSKKQSWPLLIDEEFIIPEKRKVSQWGRIGLTFSSYGNSKKPTWKPGLFFGFVVDGSDHFINDLLDDGPIAAVILSINEKRYPRLKDNGHYEQWIQELRANMPNGWHISDRTESTNRINKWHPLIIYKNLSDFIGDANTLDKQQQTYSNQMFEIQNLFKSSAQFQLFCDHMRDIV